MHHVECECLGGPEATIWIQFDELRKERAVSKDGLHSLRHPSNHERRLCVGLLDLCQTILLWNIEEVVDGQLESVKVIIVCLIDMLILGELIQNLSCVGTLFDLVCR